MLVHLRTECFEWVIFLLDRKEWSHLNQTSAVHKSCFCLSNAWMMSVQTGSCSNPALLTWILHSGVWWLWSRMGEAARMISSGLWVHYGHSRSANLAKRLEVSWKLDSAAFSSIREKASGDMGNKTPPVPAQGIKANSDKMLDVQQLSFSHRPHRQRWKGGEWQKQASWGFSLDATIRVSSEARVKDGSYLHVI